MKMKDPLRLFDVARDLMRKDFRSPGVTDAFLAIFDASINFLRGARAKPLVSEISGKNYFAFEKKQMSRAVNGDLFTEDRALILDFVDSVKCEDFCRRSPEDITRACYTMAMSFCATVDLLKAGDQKTPGTFFEYFIGHLFARRVKTDPRKELDVLNLDMRAKLPTDFIFDLGENKPKYHLPIKTSTRERVIQVWAHQRILDGIYGTGRFTGTLVCLSETKTDSRSLKVIEICLPDQWKIYQLFIAQLKRIYYLDVPRRYESLSEAFCKITVLPFGHFFHEADSLCQ